MSRIDEIFNHAEVSEKVIERYLVTRVVELGGRALKYYNANSTGYPDRIVILPGKSVFWVELKSKGKKLRPLQELRHKELRAIGQRVYTCDSTKSVDNVIEKEFNLDE